VGQRAGRRLTRQTRAGGGAGVGHRLGRRPTWHGGCRWGREWRQAGCTTLGGGASRLAAARRASGGGAEDGDGPAAQRRAVVPRVGVWAGPEGYDGWRTTTMWRATTAWRVAAAAFGTSLGSTVVRTGKN
jgi:hypothetical protein